MGACFSKPARTDEADKATSSVPVSVSGTVPEQPKQDAVQHFQQLDSLPSSASVSAKLPPVLEGWTQTDVQSWAAGLGLGPTAAAALQGYSGQQLLQLTDKGLLQLGVQDAAERQALLTARKNFQQQEQQQAQQQQQGVLEDSTQHTMVLPTPGTPPGASAGQSVHAAACSNTADSLQDTDGNAEGSKKSVVRFAPNSLAEQGSGSAGQQQGSGDLPGAAELADQGETQDIQVLRITSAGRFFRHNRPVPVLLVPLCQAVCMLHDVRRGAHYHQDNCHHLLQRLILVQDYLLALPLTELSQHGVLLAKLSVLVQDVYDVFNQFSDRGWLLRLLGPVRDEDDFHRLDQKMVNALQQAGVDTSQPPLMELSAARVYQPQQQQLEHMLKQLGIARLLRDPLSATLRLQSLLNHLPSGSNIEVLLQQEMEHYLSSCQQFTAITSSDLSGLDTVASRANSGSDSSMHKGANGNSAQAPRRSSSSGPLTAAGRARAAAMAVIEPYMVLRNDTVRAEWRSVFGARERITWKEFWHKLVQPQAHIWGLDRQLDKFTTDYVQQHLQRGSHGLLTLSEMDFAFPPNVSPAMIVQARLKGHASVSSAGLSPVQFGSRNATNKKSQLPGGIGWLREVRLLQDPNPRLHNFPEFPSSYIARDDEVSELVLVMADVSTNLVMLTGAQGVGRSMLATSLAQELVSSQHWTDAYWIDMQGISNVVLAGQQLMAGLGLVSDVADTQQLLAWLEGRPRERFGIVLTHVQDLVMAPAEEHQGFLDLLDNILHSSHKLQVVVVCEEALPRITYSARTVDVGPLTEHLATEMVKEAQPDVSEEHCRFVVDVCSGAPVALSVVCNLLRYGHCDAAEFVRLYTDPRLPLDRSLSNTSTGTTFLPFESRATNERLQRVIVAAMVNLPDVLVGTLFVLSLLPSPFTLELFGPLLALAQTKTSKHSVLRRLVNLGLLSYNASLQQYSMHKVVREAARLLAHNLDLPFNETRHNYAERVVGTARRLVLPLLKKNRMLSARLAWSRLAVHVVQLLNWAFQEVKPEMLPLYVSLAWDLTPLLSSSCSSHTLQGFCQMVLERSQFLDANLESAKMMTVLASLLAESGALKRADTLLRQALELFWREFQDPTPTVARCYRELGALMLKAGKAAEAAKHLQQALEIKEPLYGSTSPELLTILQLQVELLRRSRKYAEAEHVCQRALGICGAAYGPSDVQVAFWKNQLAQVLRQAGRPSEAQSLSEEALSLLQGQLGSEHPRVAAQLMILGQLAAQQNKQAVAEQTFRKALQVYQSVSGLHHPDTFNCLTSLVALLRGAGKASQALPLAQRCLAVKKKSLGELHPDTAASMQVVADVMLDLGRYAEVEANCNRAVWVYQQINQPANSRPVITATTMQALALVLLGRASEAEQLATSCLEAAKQLPGPVGERNSFVASCFNCLGEVYREMGRLAESEAAAREGLGMREQDMGAEHPVVAISLQTLGHVLRLRQQLDEALEVAKRCEALRSASSSQAQGPQMAAALYLQALIYSDMGSLPEAYEKAQAALSMRQKVLSSDHPDLAHSLTAVAEIFLLQNKFTDAEPLLSHAVQIFIAQLGSSHPATQRAHALLKQANNPHTASGSMSMAMRLASDSTEMGSSHLASKDLSRSNSLARQLSASASAATAASVPSVAAAAAPRGAEYVPALPRQAAAGASTNVPAGQAMEAELATAASAGAASKAISIANSLEQRLSDPQSTTGSPLSVNDTTTGTNVAVSISTHIGAAQQSSSPAPANSASSGYLDMQHRRSSDAAFDRLPDAQSAAAAGLAAAGSLAPSAAGRSVSKVSAEGGSGAVAADVAATEAALAARQGSLGVMPRIGSMGQLAGSGSSGAAAAAAAADPAQWELGRQLGQPVALTSGAAEPDAGAYNMVLAELTRRASHSGMPEDKDVALHEEGMPKAAAAAAAQKAQAAARARGSSAGGDSGRAGMPPLSPARGASGNMAAAAAAGGAGTLLAELGEAAGSGDVDAAADAQQAAAAAGIDGPEGTLQQTLARLGQIEDIEDMRAFLREHGWQLSRLSDDREGATRAQAAGADGSDPIPAPTTLAAAAAAAMAGQDGAGAIDFDLPKSAPLPAPELDLKAGSSAAGMDGPASTGRPDPRWGPFAAAAQQPLGDHGYHQQQQQYRRPPARHYSFVRSRDNPNPVSLEAAWSGGNPPRSPRSLRQRMPGAGVATYYDDRGLHGQAAYQQQQRVQRPRVDPGTWDTVWPEHADAADEGDYAEQLYYQQMIEAQQQLLHAQEQGPWGHPQQPMHSRSRSVASQGAPGSRTMTTADVAQVIEAMRERYQPMQHYGDEDSFSASAAAGMHHAVSVGYGRPQLSPAWSAGLIPGAAGYGVPRTAAAAGRGRVRRSSFDMGAHRAAQAAQSSHSIWSQAAAAAVAECGYPAQMQPSSELEQLQLQQQHMSSLYAAAAQQSPELAGTGQQQQQQHMAQECGGGPMPAGHSGTGLMKGGSAGSSSNRGSGHSGSYSYGHQQLAAAGASASAGVPAAAAGALQGARTSSVQQGPLSPGVSSLEQQQALAGGSRAGSSGIAGVPGMLPKYPSNISSYSAVSASSARSGGPRDDAQGSNVSQQQQGDEAAAAAAGSGAPPSARSSRLGTVSPEAGLARQQQESHQQQQALLAAKARSAVGISRQGSGRSVSDMSPPSMLSPRPQQQHQGSGGQIPGSSGPASARSGRVPRPNVSFNMPTGQQQPQQLHLSGSHLDYAQEYLQQQQQQEYQQQQLMDADTNSPCYAAAAGYRGMPAQQRQQQQLLSQLRLPMLQQQLQQQLYADDDEHYGMLSPAQQHYLDAADEVGHWPGDMVHPSIAAALAVSGGMSAAYNGPPPPVQHPYMSGSGPASTGSVHSRVAVSNHQRIASLLASLGNSPQGIGAGPSGAVANLQQQQQLQMLLQTQQAAAADAAAWEAEMAAAEDDEERLEAASKVVMLHQQVANVQAARAELQSQQQEIEAYLAFTQMSGVEQQQVLDLLNGQHYHQQQQQQQLQQLQQQMQRPLSPHLNVLGTGMGSSSSAQVPRQQRGPGSAAYMPPVHPGGVQMMQLDGAAAAGVLGQSAFLQRATSTASTASLGSPTSTHSARVRAAAAAVAAAASGVRPSTPEQAAAGAAANTAGKVAEDGQGDAAAAQLAELNNDSRAPSPASSQPPGSPTGSRSTPSRSALSRGASGNYETQASGLPPAAGAVGAAAGRKGGLMGQRSISPDRVRRPASAAAVLGAQQQQKPLHRLHRDNSYDQQLGQVTEAPLMAGAQRTGSAGVAPQQRSPTNPAMRGPPVQGMPPMPASAWQQHMPAQQFVQMMLAQQQQQQPQLPPQALPRRPARMSSPSPYAPTSPVGMQAGANSGYLPGSAGAYPALAAQQQQQQQQLMLQQQGLGLGSNSLPLGSVPLGHSGSRQGLQGVGMGATVAGFRGAMGSGSAGSNQGRPAAAMAAAGQRMPPGPASTAPAGRAGSFSTGLPGRPLPQQQQQMGMPGMGCQQASAVYTQSNQAYLMQQQQQQQQMASLLLRQQQLRQQQQMLAGSAAAALAAAAGGRGSYGGSSQHDGDSSQQYEGNLGPQGSEDYGMWATPPDYGAQVHADEASSRGASGNSKSFVAASGGQYWQGRRSNSWSNLPDAVLGGELTSPHSQSLPRSRSSDDIPAVAVLRQVTEAASAQQQQ